MKQDYKVQPPVVVGEFEVVKLTISPYQHGTAQALQGFGEHEPLVTLSKNLPEHSHELGPMEFFVKNYAEGEPWYKAFVDRGILVPTGREVRSGFVTLPICRLDLKQVNTRFQCPTCQKTFPTTQAREWEENRLIYCPGCIKALDDDFDGDIDFAVADIEIDESKIRRK